MYPILSRHCKEQRSPRSLRVESLETRDLLSVDYVVHISVDGIGGPYLEDLVEAAQLSGNGFENFRRLVNEGSYTFNARTDFTHTNTLPNHTSMLTGRPVLAPAGQQGSVSHNWTSNTDPPLGVTLHNNHPDVAYVSSTFDVAHDHGLTTSLYANKTKFSIYTTSYDSAHGALDTNAAGGDNGRDKIDTSLILSNTSDLVASYAESVTNDESAAYTFIHMSQPDAAGHSNQWGSTVWQQAVQASDDHLGNIFAAIESSDAMNGRTAIILTSDHGGIGTNHADESQIANFRIPFFAWGPDFSGGTNLYSVFSQTVTDPGTARPDYNAVQQPIRNGDSGNLALSLLGLPNIPGSGVTNLAECDPNDCSVVVPSNPPPRVLDVTINNGEYGPSRLFAFTFSFSEDVSASLSLNDLSIFNETTSLDVNNLLFTDMSPSRGHWEFLPNRLAPEFYRVTLDALGVTDTDGVHLDGNNDGVPGDSWQGSFLAAAPGDANLDGKVDGIDFNLLNGPSQPGNWEDGDFSGDATVDASDIDIWFANRFRDLRPPPARNPATPRSALATPSDEDKFHPYSIRAEFSSDGRTTHTYYPLAIEDSSRSRFYDQTRTRRGTKIASSAYVSHSGPGAFWPQSIFSSRNFTRRTITGTLSKETPSRNGCDNTVTPLIGNQEFLATFLVNGQILEDQEAGFCRSTDVIMKMWQ